MNINDVLTGFARTGGVGVLRPGESLDDASSVLGEPEEADYFPDKKQSWPRTFRYGDIRLEVCRCRRIKVVALSTWTESVEIPTEDARAMETMAPTTTFADLKQVLALAGARWELDEFRAVTSQFAILVEPAIFTVRFTFHVPDPDAAHQKDASLHSAISKDSGHVCVSGA
ncbi:hypothetical protein ACIHCQ_10950 [Streptomyces sp. NPDC052236]|uniref:hypothetical protein n=1 Tax=Streptomyces sp. NPDC052236 TaxID=3365686 RepID=UPI0037D5A713